MDTTDVEYFGEMGTPNAASLRAVGLDPPAAEPARAESPPNARPRLYLSLHTARPDRKAGQQSNEATFSGYARVPMVAGSPEAPWSAEFPFCRDGAETITHIGWGAAPCGPARLVNCWELPAPVTVSRGISVRPMFNNYPAFWRTEYCVDGTALAPPEPATPAAPARAAPERPRPPREMVAPASTVLSSIRHGASVVALLTLCAGVCGSFATLYSSQRRLIIEATDHLARSLSYVYQVQRASDAVLEANIAELRRLTQRAADAAERAQRDARRARRMPHGRRP